MPMPWKPRIDWKVTATSNVSSSSSLGGEKMIADNKWNDNTFNGYTRRNDAYAFDQEFLNKWQDVQVAIDEISTEDPASFATKTTPGKKAQTTVTIPKLVPKKLEPKPLPVSQETAEKAAKLLGYKTALKENEIVAFEQLLYDLNIAPFSNKVVEQYKKAVLENENRKRRDRTFGEYLEWEKTSLKKYSDKVPQNVLTLGTTIAEKAIERNIPVEFFIDHLTLKKADPFLIVHAFGRDYYVAVWDEPTFDPIKAQLAQE